MMYERISLSVPRVYCILKFRQHLLSVEQHLAQDLINRFFDHW